MADQVTNQGRLVGSFWEYVALALRLVEELYQTRSMTNGGQWKVSGRMPMNPEQGCGTRASPERGKANPGPDYHRVFDLATGEAESCPEDHRTA